MNKVDVVAIGWGQVTKHVKYMHDVDPLFIMKEASLLAVETAENKDILKNIDGIMTVKSMSYFHKSASKNLAAIMNLTPNFFYDSKIGGNWPQLLVNKAGGMLARGELETVLITGAEAYYTDIKSGHKSKNKLFDGIARDYSGNDIIGSKRWEMNHGMFLPIHGFPLFEVALWAKSGLSLNEYYAKIGKMWSNFSVVASNNKYAWLKDSKNSREITTQSKHNPMIVFPYPKFMNPIVTVNMGAAVILTSSRKMGKYKKKSSRPVYFIGGGYAQDRQRYIIERSDFTSSPPLKAAANKALRRAKMNLEEIQCFDLYSCFPCAISIAKKMLNITAGNSKQLTLTGGLGFFGGPGNNYSLHAIATILEMIGNSKIENGMITSLGWFFHKHSAGIYSSKPSDNDISYDDIKDDKNCLVGYPPVNYVENFSGMAVIETYTIFYYGREKPAAIIYGRTKEKGERVIGISEDSDIISFIIEKNRVGDEVKIFNKLNKNFFKII